MFACNMCSSADPASDTVKVNFNAMPAEDADKENQPGANQVPPALADDAVKAREKAAREQEKKAEEEQRRRAEAEAELAEKQRRLLEQRRREEEAALREAAEAQRRAEAEERRVAADAEAKRQQAVEEAEARRKAHEDAEQEREEQRQLQEQLACDKAKLEAFLKEHGYSGPNAKRTKMFKTKYPLHTAVKINEPDMVRILLAAGADGGSKNSAGLTAAQLAKKTDKQGSHAEVLRALDGF